MSSNSRIQKAIMINWKGMFFQSFDIDPSMTILEGANGTGKTTIMIAVYTCLMPDLNYLNFQNVTTVSSRRNEDKGLYGRIGQDDKSSEEPIFSLLDILTASGERIVVGVQFVKKTYPQVLLKHFAITNLPQSLEIESLLINYNNETNQQEILDLQEIKERCQQNDGELTSFRHAKDYFRFLFEKEISPLRLVENEDRKKYNQLLHTSLYGGLSRSLHSSLRDYLLPENDKLVKGIQEMEQNLHTCRRTRSAIERYQKTREVIRSVYRTGLDMFSSAFYATRLDAELKQKKSLELRKEKRSIRLQWEEQSTGLVRLRDEQVAAEKRINGLELDYQKAKDLLNQITTAEKVAGDIKKKQKEEKKQQSATVEAQEKLNEIQQRLDNAQTEERKLASKQMELAHQLSNAGQAWQELSKQVGLYQQAASLLDESKEKMGLKELPIEEIPTLLSNAQQQADSSQEGHQKIYFEFNESKLKKEHFVRYFNLLNELIEDTVSSNSAGEKAKEILSAFFQFEQEIKELDQIPVQLGSINEKIRNRQRIFEGLASAGLKMVDSSDLFESTRSEVLAAYKSTQAELKEVQQGIEQKSRDLGLATSGLADADKKLEAWEQFQIQKKLVEDRTAQTINTLTELTDLASYQDEQLQKVSYEKHELTLKRKRLQANYNTLVNESSTKKGLKGLAEQGFGSLLSEKYEEIPLEWSANLESRLGPLAEALVVKDVQKVASDLTSAFERPDEVWLVEEGVKDKMPEALEMGDSILVKHGDAWRLKRLPEVPVLGKAARSARVEAYGTQIKEVSDQLEKKNQTLKTIKENQDLIAGLLSQRDLVDSESPKNSLDELKEGYDLLNAEIKKLQSKETSLIRKSEELEEQEECLRQFYPLKDLLDDDELDSEKKRLETLQSQLRKLETKYGPNRDKFRQLQQGVEFLQTPPEEELKELEEQERSLRIKAQQDRETLELVKRLDDAKEHLQYVDQVALLEEKQSINQHLEEKLKEIEDKLTSLKSKIEQDREEVRLASDTANKEQAKFNTLQGQVEILRQNLEELGLTDENEGIDKITKEVNTLASDKKELEVELNKILENRYRLEAEIKQIQENGKRIDGRYKSALRQSRPAVTKWHRFHSQAKQEKTFDRLLADYFGISSESGQTPEKHWRKVSASQATLTAVLEKIHDAKTVLNHIKEILGDENAEADQGEISLAIWRRLLVYLKQVIPVDLQTDDPDKAQEIISQKLENLMQNLDQQERSLRMHVQGIPSHINAEIRKQKNRIRKLNQKLESVRFGFLQSIRINIETQPKLKRFLSILPQQLDIFTETNEENVSIEALMADLYEREGAGKVKGDLLLDYRHYVGLGIEVKREGNSDYEKVTSTNLSTGESIGVGIAVLIMVLMSWEEQYLHPSEASTRGSVRFLLLDESSRLDQKALQTLTDFCEQLSLQLLIAAPSVERSLRGTTHHLTRGYFNGREEVVVRGRRITGPLN